MNIQKAVELLKSSVKASSKNNSEFMKALLDRAEEAEKKEKEANERLETLENQVKSLQVT